MELLLKSTPYVFSATHKHPKHPMSVLPEPDVVGYDGGDATACHDQLVAFLQANPPVHGDDLPRQLAYEIAHKVGLRHCSHVAEPQPLADMSHAARKKAAAEHPGLCGVYHARIIAAVKTSDVVEKWGEENITANKYRNQVCERPSGSRFCVLAELRNRQPVVPALILRGSSCFSVLCGTHTTEFL